MNARPLLVSFSRGPSLLVKRQLSDASVFIGDFNDGGEIQAKRKKIKWGYSIQVSTDIKWLACYYGSGHAVSWLEETHLDPKSKTCDLRIIGRENIEAKLICK